MGFFALAGRDVRITVQQKDTDQSWLIEATPDSFSGAAPILCSEGPVDHKDMTILISAKNGENFIPAATHAARYLTLEVVVDGTLADRTDFLADADFIEDWNGIRIGIYPMPQNRFRNDTNVNFHGVTLYAKLPSLSQQFHRSYYARLDVTHCTNLKLVLPARKHYHVICDDHLKVVLPGECHESVERPDTLEIHCEIGSFEGVEDWSLCTGWLIFGEDNEQLDEVDIAVTKRSKATSDDLVDFLENAVFCSSDDAEAGSFDQQQSWFRDAAEDLAITLLETSVEADINAVIRIVNRELYWLRRKSSSVTIRIVNGRVEVEGLDAKSHAA